MNNPCTPEEWTERWTAAGCFSPSGEGTPYSLSLPPPNVTGTLHMGHAFQDTLMDILIRSHRMRGYNTLWQGGLDHAGIATQMVVERQCAQQGLSRHDLGREAFIEKIWEWKKTSGDTILAQLGRLGASIDPQTIRFTMDPDFSQAVLHVFVRLYREGLLYRGKRLVYWDPVLETAVSDLEVQSDPENGHLWTIRYPLKAQPGSYIAVATTRPETLLGDQAVAVHPEDTRYAALIGQSVHLPVCGREIPIIADSSIDPDFGTGAVKITPAHDFHDFSLGQKHGLHLLSIFDSKACCNEHTPLAYQGLDRMAARKKILEELSALTLLEKVEDHVLQIPRGDRSQAILEPRLSDQWFVRTADFAQKARALVESKKIRFVPQNWENTFFDWMDRIEDWCISRQLWWGHRIPAFYDPQGQEYVGLSEEEVRSFYQIPQTTPLTQDGDVLDTWFSSALWPFATLGWPEHTAAFKRFYPNNVLVTGFDIIFFWVARMIFMGDYLTGQPPFHTVYIHGLILDGHGQKMSKSKGNIIDPLDIIDGISLEDLLKKRTSGLMQPQMAQAIARKTREEFPQGIAAYGVDALRFTLCALATQGRFVRFDFKRLEGYRHFCTKLKNATRFILLQQNAQPALTQEISEELQQTPYAIWLYDALNAAIADAYKHLAEYRFDLLAQSLHHFMWDVFCDWGIEWAKNQPLLVTPLLLDVLKKSLALLHPIIPFITEECWALLGETTLLAQSPYPLDPQQSASAAPPAVGEGRLSSLDCMKKLQEWIIAFRAFKKEWNIAAIDHLWIELATAEHSSAASAQETACFLAFLTEHDYLWTKLLKVKEYSILQTPVSDDQASHRLKKSIQHLLISFVPPENMALSAEKIMAERLRQKEKLEKEYRMLAEKLSQDHFIQKAPPEVVSHTQKRLKKIEELMQELNQQET